MYWDQERYNSWNYFDIPSSFPFNRADGPDLQNIMRNLYSLKMKLRSIDDVKQIPLGTRNYLRLAFKAVCACQLTKKLPNPTIRESLDVALSDILDNIIPQLELGNDAPYVPFRNTAINLLMDYRDIRMICQELENDLEEYLEKDYIFNGMSKLFCVLLSQYPNSK
ncbi:hypothetical protein Glove_360g86 [Diversispora epigaea]|uniref:Uncharacterized protein n=1 Tax=Diversispora epigaea TaxID=1348612 RepID=A0A397HA06_9GLOM|nr:hypothetical protein Glove_360g86 [Diversispora epigaea]